MSASAMVVCILSSEGKTSDDEIPPPIRYERLPGVTAWRLILADISQGIAGATVAEMISQRRGGTLCTTGTPPRLGGSMSRSSEPQVRILVFRLASREAAPITYLFSNVL